VVPETEFTVGQPNFQLHRHVTRVLGPRSGSVDPPDVGISIKNNEPLRQPGALSSNSKVRGVNKQEYISPSKHRPPTQILPFSERMI
jgi:hypothetical protein